jgi:hypothetical protein
MEGHPMNARLLEIVKQSGLLKILEQHAGEFGTGTFIDTPYPEVEKFAELVIAAYTPPPHPIYLASDGRFYDIPQRQKPLTDDRINEIAEDSLNGYDRFTFTRAIEREHRII